MNKKTTILTLLSIFTIAMMLQTAKAAQITVAAPDKTTYQQGQTGYVSVSIFNDEDQKIRVTEISINIDYYYADRTVYLQTFYYPSSSLPDETPAGQTTTYQVPISLPNNIAAGYPQLRVEAHTEIWVQDSRWVGSDRPYYNDLQFYVESPYKQSYETSQAQLQEEKTVNTNLSNTINMLAITSLIFAGATAFLVLLVFMHRRRLIAPTQ